MFSENTPSSSPTVWAVGALCRAIADSLEARFNPVSVRGEISGFSRAASGHCYFSIKDAAGQLRCAMFRRDASALGFMPRDGELVEVRGRLGVYEQRGDLQLIVQAMQRAGQGAWFEQFVRLKAQLESEGLFDAERKRPLPVMPRGIGLVTSMGAAALHDVATALQRRVPHIPVVLVPALVQGASAPASLMQALQQLYERVRNPAPGAPPLDVIVLVRGGGSMEDLWAFNDEQLARTIVQSPVPLVSGVGHETDFTIADFCADVRAPTPTAAAEMLAHPTAQWLQALAQLHQRVEGGLQHWLDRQSQRLDMAAQRLGRPSGHTLQQRARCERLVQAIHHSVLRQLQQGQHTVQVLQRQWPLYSQRQLAQGRQQLLHAAQRLSRPSATLAQQRLHCAQLEQRIDSAAAGVLQLRQQQLRHMAQRLALLNPAHVLQRGYSLLTDSEGRAITRTAEAPVGSALKVHLSDGAVDVTVTQPKLL